MKIIACMALSMLAGCPSRSLEIGITDSDPYTAAEQDLSSSMDMVGQWADMVSAALDMASPVPDLLTFAPASASSCSWYLNGVIQNAGICLVERKAAGISTVRVGPVGDGAVLIDFAAVDTVAKTGTYSATEVNNLVIFIGRTTCSAAGSVQVYGSPMTVRVYANCARTGESAFLRIITSPISVPEPICAGSPCGQGCGPKLQCINGGCQLLRCAPGSDPCPSIGLTCYGGECRASVGQSCNSCSVLCRGDAYCAPDGVCRERPR